MRIPGRIRRRAERIAGRQPKHAWWRYFESAVALGAGLVAIAGVVVWILEWGDRDRDRAGRRAELILQANSILTSAATSGFLEIGLDPNIAWAITTLAALDAPINLHAELSVDLKGLQLSCATIAVSAPGLMLDGASLENVAIQFKGDDISFVGARTKNAILRLDSGAQGDVRLWLDLAEVNNMLVYEEPHLKHTGQVKVSTDRAAMLDVVALMPMSQISTVFYDMGRPSARTDLSALGEVCQISTSKPPTGISQGLYEGCGPADRKKWTKGSLFLQNVITPRCIHQTTLFP